MIYLKKPTMEFGIKKPWNDMEKIFVMTWNVW